MTLGTRLSFQDQKNEVKLLTQSAAKWICMGKWPVAIYFSGFRKAQDVQIFSGASFAPNVIPENNLARTDEGAGTHKN